MMSFSCHLRAEYSLLAAWLFWAYGLILIVGLGPMKFRFIKRNSIYNSNKEVADSGDFFCNDDIVIHE